MELAETRQPVTQIGSHLGPLRETIIEDIRQGKSVEWLCAKYQGPDLTRHLINMLHHAYMPGREAKPHVFVLHAPFGQARTDFLKACYRTAYWKAPCNIFWDGYEGQGVVILDDYAGWMGVNVLTTLTSSCKYSVPVRLSYQPMIAKQIVILTSIRPTHWYYPEERAGFYEFIRNVDTWAYLEDSELTYCENLTDLETYCDKVYNSKLTNSGKLTNSSKYSMC